MSLPGKVVGLTTTLTTANVPHAFGGALALAYCIPEPRATIDIDLNVFVSVNRAAPVLEVLPTGVEHDHTSLAAIERDGQVRLWWEHTPVDLFFNTTSFHEEAMLRTRRGDFGPTRIPVLACRDLAVFKAFFDRSKDWVDLEHMAQGGALDFAAVAGVLVDFLGADDHRVRRLLALRAW